MGKGNWELDRQKEDKNGELDFIVFNFYAFNFWAMQIDNSVQKLHKLKYE